MTGHQHPVIWKCTLHETKRDLGRRWQARAKSRKTCNPLRPLMKILCIIIPYGIIVIETKQFLRRRQRRLDATRTSGLQAGPGLPGPAAGRRGSTGNLGIAMAATVELLGTLHMYRSNFALIPKPELRIISVHSQL